MRARSLSTAVPPPAGAGGAEAAGSGPGGRGGGLHMYTVCTSPGRAGCGRRRVPRPAGPLPRWSTATLVRTY